MRFSAIVLKNFKQNLRHYGIYLFSLMLSIALYFSFVTLKYTDSIANGENAKLLNSSAGIGEKFLFVIIIIFLMYANRLFIKRRTKSFALFQLIGLSRKDLMRMMMLEQAIIFIGTTVIGLLLGLFGSRLLLLIVKKTAQIPLDIKILFEPAALIVTMILVVISFILIMVQSFIFIKRRSIIQLMYDVQQSEATQANMTKAEMTFGILGIAMIGLGYYLSTIMLKNIELTLISAFLILFLTVVGAYFFFRSSVSLIFKSLKRSKRGYVNVTDVVFTASIMHRMKKNAFSLTVIGIISAITITLLSFATISKANIENNVNGLAPHEFTYINEGEAQKLEAYLNAKNIPYNKVVQHVIEVPIVHSDKALHKDVNSLPIISDAEVDKMDVNPGEITLVNYFKVSETFIGLDEGVTIDLGRKEKHAPLEITETSPYNVLSYRAALGRSVGIIDHKTFEMLKATQIKDKDNPPITQVGFDLKSAKDVVKVESANEQFNQMLPQSRTSLEKEQLAFSGMFLFVSGFLGVAFLIAAGCIIYIKQMDENEDEMANYQILRKMGYTHQDMFKGLALKIAFNFGLPLIIGLGHAFFAARAFNTLMNGVDFAPVIFAMTVYAVIYLIFAVLAYYHSRRVIKFSI
ncbi:TPA: ABC transporter permease [Staphylococcus pseudintermedius]|uniref:ABC transporter permease n=6 Tax=Staphylococcus pseudintermedius TaxID=283734 RepID=A0A8A7URU7_STAPS|nr:ABC transporter permease [Staphylococcus pseudintermedius]ADV04899.1 Bacitracin export permease protein BceB [Staphylococcus pseudintermedius HKU10-03]ANQ89099.1 bacitracin ABC transporter permease [Staphylococcus pseudintermedius]EGQ0289959.1 ABC transporter permease [Staphylococcus pseudintermedius]EGQ0305471.1 ABC transporter permease [Staphylococcus pseudintermedius]EGQ0318047.1 ABC transporter permease [Staphylococcus pseudintermedius]